MKALLWDYKHELDPQRRVCYKITTPPLMSCILYRMYASWKLALNAKTIIPILAPGNILLHRQHFWSQDIKIAILAHLILMRHSSGCIGEAKSRRGHPKGGLGSLYPKNSCLIGSFGLEVTWGHVEAIMTVARSIKWRFPHRCFVCIFPHYIRGGARAARRAASFT